MGLIIIIIFNLHVQAQPPSGQGERPSASEMAEKTTGDLSKEVTLTTQEESSIKEILTDFYAEMDEMHENGSRPDHSKIEELEQKRDDKVAEILSEEKFEVYAEFMKNHMKPPKGERPPPPGH